MSYIEKHHAATVEKAGKQALSNLTGSTVSIHSGTFGQGRVMVFYFKNGYSMHEYKCWQQFQGILNLFSIPHNLCAGHIRIGIDKVSEVLQAYVDMQIPNQEHNLVHALRWLIDIENGNY